MKNNCKLFIASFGEANEEQKQIIKSTSSYKCCELADAVESLMNEYWKEFKIIIFKILKGK